MSDIRPFKGLRPRADLVKKVASPPYDVLNSAEARVMAAGNPHSFLHVVKAEIDMEPGIETHSEPVYAKSAENLVGHWAFGLSARHVRDVIVNGEITVRHGKKVVELLLVTTDKGRALETVRGTVGAGAVLFLGDDITDENVFSRLGADHVGVKVGDGPTSAPHRVDDVEAVADLLERLDALAGGFDEAH